VEGAAICIHTAGAIKLIFSFRRSEGAGAGS